MGIHSEHIVSKRMRDCYDRLLSLGEADSGFDVKETGPTPKRDVRYYYAGRRSWPFAFIVNSGERADYHLFYLRHKDFGNYGQAIEFFDQDQVEEKANGEVIIRVHDKVDVEKVWQVVNRLRIDQ